MGNKIILTESQHEMLLNHIVNEIVTGSVNKNGTINENFWEKIKYGISKLGRYKAGGKIFGKGKTDEEAAAKIKEIIEKQANIKIKELNDLIQKTNPEFPNNEKGAEFLGTVMSISAVYDSIVASANPEKPETIETANALINDLKEYVKKFLDVDLTAGYSGLDEEINNGGIEVSEEELAQLDEEFGLTEAKDPNQMSFDFDAKNPNNQVATTNKNQVATTSGNAQVASSKPKVTVSGKGTQGNKPKQEPENIDFEDIPNSKSSGPAQTSTGNATGGADAELDASDVRAQLKAKRGDGEDYESERMKTLKSNKLPMTLVGVGASLGAFSWLVNTEWFKHLFETISKTESVEMIKKIVETKSDIFANVKPGDGLTQTMNALNNAGLSPNTTPEEFLNQVKILGGGNLTDGINAITEKGGLMGTPDQARQVLMEIVKNPHGHGDTLGQIFQGKWAGTGKNVGDMLTVVPGGQLHGIVVKMLTQAIPKIVIKTTVKTGAGLAIAKGLGAWLGPIGIGLVTAGALVKLFRLKGQKQSRAATLNDLFQSIRPIAGGVGIIKPETPPIAKEEAQNPKIIDDKNKEEGTEGGEGDKVSRGTGASNDDLYNSLLNMFRFVVSSNKKFGGGPENQTNTELFKKGDNVIYKGKNVTVTIPNVSPGYTQIDADGNGPQKKTYAVKTADLKKQVAENILFEGRYIKDKELINYLNKNISVKRVKEFEDFMNLVEQIRNKIRNIKDTDDKVFNSFLVKFRENPIILTDFQKMFNISSTNPQAYENFKNFIEDVFKSVYTGKFKNGELMSKLAGMGKVNVSEAQFERSQIEKDAQDRKKFKNNLMKFMTDAIGLFQYMFQQKKNTAAKTGQQPQNTKKQLNKLKPKTNTTATKPANTGNVTQTMGTQPANGATTTSESKVVIKTPLMVEELNRIKKIMLDN